MSSESGDRRRRRLILAGLVLSLVPMTARPSERPACDTHNSFVGTIVCTPIELLRIAGPIARYFILSGRPGESRGTVTSHPSTS
jgi:hypothetical protein